MKIASASNGLQCGTIKELAEKEMEYIVKHNQTVIVLGLGEVGRPLFDIISTQHPTFGVDVEPPQEIPGNIDVMHVCYPFHIRDFLGETARYIETFKPKLTVINSTVAIGTTRKISEMTGSALAHSPVRGKHTRMRDEIYQYKKFVGAADSTQAREAADHFASVGLRTQILSSPEATELAKLTETTYFGLMIAWAQQVERYCDALDVDYSEIASFYEEIKFFPPVKYFPGVIGGHCVMPNIEILRKFTPSDIIEAIKASNEMKVEREKSRKEKLSPQGIGV